MKMKLFKYLTIALITPVVFTSCIKNNVTELTDQGTTMVSVLQAPENALFFSPFTEIRNVDLFSIRKDVPSSAELNSPLTVTLTENMDLLDAYNEENGSDFEWLPDSLYTLADGIVRNGSTYTVTMNSGDFAKEFSIKLNGAKWDLAYKYAVAFTISDAGGKVIPEGKRDIIAMVSIKNQWDGVYEVTGTCTDVVAPYLKNVNDFLNSAENIYGIEPPMQYELRTMSATKCAVYDNYFYGGYYMPLSVDNEDGTYSYSSYGSFCAIFEFNAETNEIIAVTNQYGQPASNTRSALIAPDGVNMYDPTTKTMQVKYYMLQPSAVPTPPHIRSTFEETWKFIGDRK